MNKKYSKIRTTILSLLIFSASLQAERTILNASIDVSRELFTQINPAFQGHWEKKTGESIKIQQSHQGSSRQARAILEGLEADVVTFNQVDDVQVLHDEGKLIQGDWQKRLAYDSSPFYSLTSFLVRKGNPKNIRDWDDLAREDITLVFPNPKTSGNARYTYLAAWAYGLKKFKGDEALTREFVGKIVRNVSVFDTGGRGATTSFVEREIGDVLITFESETNGIRKQYGEHLYDVVTPSLSISGLFPVSVVDSVVKKKGTTDIAEAYLAFLYLDEAQEIIARNYYRPRSSAILKKYASQFPQVQLLEIEQIFSNPLTVNEAHFGNGGIFDQLIRR